MDSLVHRINGFEVRTLPIDQLTPAPYNPRKTLKPTDAAYRKLESSLREFGLVEPLVWNELSGHIVGGHARLAILKKLGVREVPVSVVNLNDAREKALNVVLNNQEAQGRFDRIRLADLLVELEDLPELELTGFDSSTLAALNLDSLAEPIVEERSGVTVTLEMTDEVYQRAEKSLNDIVAEFDLKCHVG